MKELSEQKTCIIAYPLEEDNSPERKRTDDLLDYILLPYISKFGIANVLKSLILKVYI